jgi:DNA-binding NtrC family response regulator
MHEEILIVDDKVQFSRSLGENLQDLGYRFRSATCTAEALSELKTGDISLVLLDIVLGEEDGLTALKRIRASHPRLPIIMITGYASISTAVSSMKLGALDYIQKPLNFTVLSKLIDNALGTAGAPGSPADGRGEQAGAPKIVSVQESMKTLIAKAKRIAETNLPVLLCGENGTGKEVFADFIHANSPRRARPLIKINCASFPESLLDNELFGHEKGAYTGADTAFRGVFERADGGTLFLDEVADMLPAIQAKILRALQNNEVRRIGGDETIKVDVRFITATNRNIAKLVADQGFREDLFYRMNAATLQIPPLRERKEDIPVLVAWFLDAHSRDGAESLRMSQDALNVLLSHQWPGNVRELKNTVSYAASLASGKTIEATDLPPGLLPAGSAAALSRSSAAPLADVERLMIESTLRRCGNNKKRAAQALRISRNTLYNKLKKYGLNPDP